MKNIYEASTNGSSIHPKEAGVNNTKIAEEVYNW